MGEHTPGPWVLSIDWIEGSGMDYVVLGADAEFIAEVFRQPTDANARLIAAAPDLLAACALAVEDSVQGWAPSGGRLWRCQVCEGEDEHINECWVAKAEAAIAKARGEQQ